MPKAVGNAMTEGRYSLREASVLPHDGYAGALVGRVWLPDRGGPAVAALRDGNLVDITARFPTLRDLCEAPKPAVALRKATGETLGRLAPVVENSWEATRDASRPWLLPPADLQAVKAAGVTFAVSMLERVIEERARGDFHAAAAIRVEIARLIGDDLSRLRPGTRPSSTSRRRSRAKRGRRWRRGTCRTPRSRRRRP